MKVLTALLFMTPSIAYCGLLPDNVKYEELMDYSGGLNTAVSANKLTYKFSPNMRNVFIHRKPGSIIKSNGYIVAGSTNSLVDGRFMFTFNKESGSKEFIVSDGSSILSTSDFQSYVVVSSGMNNSVNLDAAQVRNKIWLTNGSDPVIVWDGTNRQRLNHVPKARYIEFFQERVFLLNTSAEGSSLDFSEITSTDGIALTPEDVRAWPATNRLYVGRGDGQVGTSLFISKGQLQAAKENSIWTLFGTGVANYYLRKIESDAGVQSNDSVVIKDGIVYYKSRDGIYSLDGGVPVRISDTIEPDVKAMVGFDTRVVETLWDTQPQFANGTFYGSTVTVDGFLTIRTDDQNINISSDGRPSGTFIQLNSTTNGSSTDYAIMIPSFTVDSGFRGRPYSVSLWAKNNGLCTNPNSSDIKIRIRHLGYPDREELNPAAFSLTTTMRKITVSVGNITLASHFSGDQINNSSFSIKITSNATPNDTCVYDVYPATLVGNSSIFMQSTPDSQFISEVRSRPDLTAWSTFDSEYVFNGPSGSPSGASNSVSYFLRTSTSSVNITTQTWVPINPGVTINAPTINKFFQFSSSVNYSVPSLTPDKNNPLYLPNVDFVVVKDIEGGGDLYRPVGITWNNEYWLTVATQTTAPTSLTYVKSWITNSNPNAWNILDGMNIRSFAKNGKETLYGGSASTGTFYRLDYGTNYNGNPIVSYYDTPDMDFGSTFLEKSIQVLNVNAEKEYGATLSVGISTNSGISFSTTVIVNLAGSGKLYKPIFGLSTLRGNNYRVRFSNSELDKGMTLYNLGLWYLPKDIWTNTGQ